MGGVLGRQGRGGGVDLLGGSAGEVLPGLDLRGGEGMRGEEPRGHPIPPQLYFATSKLQR